MRDSAPNTVKLVARGAGSFLIASRDTCRQRWARRAWLTALSLILGACDGVSTLRVQLRQLGDDAPYRGVAVLRIEVERRGEKTRVAEYDFNGRSFEIEPLEREEGQTIRVEGHDVAGRLLASGHVSPDLPRRGGSCCVVVCFCSIARVDRGDCSCGSNRCQEVCSAQGSPPSFVCAGNVLFRGGYSIGAGASAADAADVNADGHVDLAASFAAGRVDVLLGYGEGSFAEPVTYAVGDWVRDLHLMDVDADGSIDLLAGRDGYPSVLLFGRGDGTFGPAVEIGTNADPANDVTLGDYDGDGDLDVIVLSRSAAPVRLYRNNGDRTFAYAHDIATSSDAVEGFSADFDGDGRIDLLSIGSGCANSFQRGRGDGAFDAPVPLPLISGAGCWKGALGDLDADGEIDLVVGVVNGANRVFFGAGDGTFSPPVLLSSHEDNTGAVAVFDLDQDGFDDVVVGNDGNDDYGGDGLFENRAYLSRGDGTFLEMTFTASPRDNNQATRRLVLSDFNGDGFVDLFAGNTGADEDSAIHLNARPCWPSH